MTGNIISLISFVVITTFTPGPNNIASASMGMAFGYRKTLGFLSGITTGFFLVMICCAFLSSTLLSVLPVSAQYLRWIGAFYIVWLAVGILRSGSAFEAARGAPVAFAKGVVLQVFNPKVAVYGLTIYTTFLAPVSDQPGLLSLLAVAFALTAFAATSTWALCGAAITTRLKNGTARKRVNLVLALMLVYTAVDLSSLINYL